jgi:hypothetical protein
MQPPTCEFGFLGRRQIERDGASDKAKLLVLLRQMLELFVQMMALVAQIGDQLAIDRARGPRHGSAKRHGIKPGANAFRAVFGLFFCHFGSPARALSRDWRISGGC